MKAKTPDERLMVQFYQMALDRGDLFCVLKIKEAARATSQKDTAVKNIVKHLAQANFIEKIDDGLVRLTPQGCRFVEEEL